MGSTRAISAVAELLYHLHAVERSVFKHALEPVVADIINLNRCVNKIEKKTLGGIGPSS